MADYRKWVQEQMLWAANMRRRQWRLLGRQAFRALVCAAITVLLCWLPAHWIGGDVWAAALIVLAGVLFFLVRQFFRQLPLLTERGYRRSIRRALMGMDPEQRERFARDQREALQQPGRRVELGTEEGQAPAQFTLGRRYACLVGGEQYGPYIIDLSRANRIRPLQRQKEISPAVQFWRETWGDSMENEDFYLCFERRPDPDQPGRAEPVGLLVFGSQQDRRQALELLRRDFQGEIWLSETTPSPNLRILK